MSDALVGQSFLLDGENWEVVEADASTRLVKYARATTERTGDVGPAEKDTDDELEDATEAESAALAAADTTVYSPDPDVRLIRNVWARKGVMERVRGVKYMWDCLPVMSYCTKGLECLSPILAPVALCITLLSPPGM